MVFFTYENRNKSDKDTIIKLDAGMCKTRHDVANYVIGITLKKAMLGLVVMVKNIMGLNSISHVLKVLNEELHKKIIFRQNWLG